MHALSLACPAAPCSRTVWLPGWTSRRFGPRRCTRASDRVTQATAVLFRTHGARLFSPHPPVMVVGRHLEPHDPGQLNVCWDVKHSLIECLFVSSGEGTWCRPFVHDAPLRCWLYPFSMVALFGPGFFLRQGPAPPCRGPAPEPPPAPPHMGAPDALSALHPLAGAAPTLGGRTSPGRHPTQALPPQHTGHPPNYQTRTCSNLDSHFHRPDLLCIKLFF